MVIPPESTGIDRQLAKLFGESLFGAWLDPLDASMSTKRPSKRRAWGRNLAITTLLVGLVFGAMLVIRRGLARQASARRARLVDDLSTFVREGELERASTILAIVRGQGADVETTRKDRDRLVRAEAALYRYHDADPGRLKAIPTLGEPPLFSGAPPDLVLAYLTTRSREERAASWPVLSDLRSRFSEDAEYHYLLATALEQRREFEAARSAWQRSAELGPLWFAHRFEQAAFERRQGQEEAATKVALTVMRVASGSVWANLFRTTFPGSTVAAPTLLSAGGASVSADGVSDGSAPSPVQIHRARLVLAVETARKGDLVGARRLLSEAVAAVRGEAPFVLDAYDWILDEGLVALGRELTAFDAWPANSPMARAKLQRLVESSSLSDRGAEKASPADASPRTDSNPKSGRFKHKSRPKGVKVTHRSAHP